MTALAPPLFFDAHQPDKQSANTPVSLHLTNNWAFAPWANHDNAMPDDGLPVEDLSGYDLILAKRLDSHQDTHEQRFRFKNHQNLRALMLKALPWAESSTSKIERFLNCGLASFVQFSDSRGAFRVHAMGCSMRTCPVCSNQKRQQMRRRILWHLAQFPRHHFKFITLTQKHSREPLAAQLDHLKASFKRLRQTTTWKKRVDGGLAFIEITFNRKTKTWHPHIHILARARFIPQALLSRLWSQSTGGSHIVDIRAVKEGEQAAEELAGYVGKIPDLLECDDPVSRWVEYYSATSGQRMVIKFGENPKEPSTYPDPDDDGKPNDWVNFLSFREFLSLCQRRSRWARRLLELFVDSSAPVVFPERPPPEVMKHVIIEDPEP